MKVDFPPEFGDVGLDWPGDVGGDEAVAMGEGHVCLQLLLNPFVGEDRTQAL